jgi:hypothetical protein
VIDGREAAGVERVGALAPDGGDLAFATAGKGGVHDLITLAGNAARVGAIEDFGAAAPGVKVTGGGDFRATEAVDQATALVRTGRLHVPIAQTFTSRTRPTPTASARTGTSAASSYSSRADARSADEGRTLSFAVGAAERRELRDGPEQRSRAGPSPSVLSGRPRRLLLVVPSERDVSAMRGAEAQRAGEDELLARRDRAQRVRLRSASSSMTEKAVSPSRGSAAVRI